MDIPLILSSLNSAQALAGALFEERDRQKAATIQFQLTEKIIQAQAKLSEVLGAVIEKDRAISALMERNRELEAAERERARYELAKLGSIGDFLAYRLRPVAELTERLNEPAHFTCQPCLDAGKKSVLHVTSTRAFCSLCQTNTQIGDDPPIRMPGQSIY